MTGEEDPKPEDLNSSVNEGEMKVVCVRYSTVDCRKKIERGKLKEIRRGGWKFFS